MEKLIVLYGTALLPYTAVDVLMHIRHFIEQDRGHHHAIVSSNMKQRLPYWIGETGSFDLPIIRL